MAEAKRIKEKRDAEKMIEVMRKSHEYEQRSSPTRGKAASSGGEIPAHGDMGQMAVRNKEARARTVMSDETAVLVLARARTVASDETAQLNHDSS